MLPYEAQIGRHLITSSKVFAITWLYWYKGTTNRGREFKSNFSNRYLVIGKDKWVILPSYSKSIIPFYNWILIYLLNITGSILIINISVLIQRNTGYLISISERKLSFEYVCQIIRVKLLNNLKWHFSETIRTLT